MAGGFCWAASAVVVKRLQATHDVDILSLTTWQMLFGSLPLLLIAALTWQGGPEWTTTFALALAYNVILGNALAWFLWLFGLRRLSAGRRRHRHAGHAGHRRRPRRGSSSGSGPPQARPPAWRSSSAPWRSSPRAA